MEGKKEVNYKKFVNLATTSHTCAKGNLTHSDAVGLVSSSGAQGRGNVTGINRVCPPNYRITSKDTGEAQNHTWEQKNHQKTTNTHKQ